MAMVTVSGCEFRVPSLTMSWATYVPGRSAVNVGEAELGLESAAVLPAGRVVKDQL